MDDESPLPGPSDSPAVSFSARHRPGYTRVASVSFSDSPTTKDITETATDDENAPALGDYSRSTGLGISRGTPAHGKRKSLPSPLQQDSNAIYSTPEHGPPMFSPPSTGALSGSTRFDDSFDTDIGYKSQRGFRDSRTSLNSANAPSTYAKSDTGLLSVRTKYDEFAHHNQCQSKKAYKGGKLGNWISVTILFLAVFASIFSAIFLVIALRGPRYGRSIRRDGGTLTPSSAAFLTSLFAKLIELAYVTVSVAFIGQALARRAFKLERAQGVTMAELNMRSWIMQPGTMITQWESVRYAGLSLLGAVSALAALMAVLYTR